MDIQRILDNLPDQPGVYLMKGRGDEVLYVGKAKNLKNRVRNYFTRSGDSRAFVEKLPEYLVDIELIITNNEKEALILENNLIKKHYPRFNVRLKDNKNFILFRIDLDKKWPRVEVVRRIKKDNSKYFGPFDRGNEMRNVLKLLNRHFGLRTCNDKIFANRSRPCMQYQIKRCSGPCTEKVSNDWYLDRVQEVILLLDGKRDTLLKGLEEQMYKASDKFLFEEAARYRDQIQAIKHALVTQGVVFTNMENRDALGFYREGDRVVISVLQIRAGMMIGSRTYPLSNQEMPDDEVLSTFINLYYRSGGILPKLLLLPFELADSELLAESLEEEKGQKLNIRVPQRGAMVELVQKAYSNAKVRFIAEHSRTARANDGCEKLQKRLKLATFPTLIECYDISNLQGDSIVGSQVSFREGLPDKTGYRLYTIRTTDGQDDFGAMAEVLQRRLRRAKNQVKPKEQFSRAQSGFFCLTEKIRLS